MTAFPPNDAQVPSIADAYLAVRQNLFTVLANWPEKESLIVPATPEWSVRDVLAHLVDNVRGTASRLAGQPSGTGLSSAPDDGRALLAEWDRLTAAVAPELAAAPRRRATLLLMDAYTHELDIRHTVGLARPDGHPAFQHAFDLVANGFGGSVSKHKLPAVQIEMDGLRWVAGDGEPAATLTGHRYDLYRSLVGRRTPAQIAALAWSADPEQWLAAFDWGPFHPPVHPVEDAVGG